MGEINYLLLLFLNTVNANSNFPCLHNSNSFPNYLSQNTDIDK